MERLTTNKDKSEMGMYELAHNSCYCKDGLSRYRDFESDIDARRNSFPNSRFTDESEPTSEYIAEAIQDAINKNPKAFIGALGLNGEFKRYTVNGSCQYDK